MADRLSYSVAEAAATLGVSQDVIRRAMKAGDISVVYPKVGKRNLSKPLIPATELEAWLRNGATERAS